MVDGGGCGEEALHQKRAKERKCPYKTSPKKEVYDKKTN